ncbi:HTH-type transcriptional regulator MtrR [compost metagenome]
MANLRKEEKEAIRECLMTKGKELFAQYGLKKTSIDQIVLSCGIAKGSFYSYFNTKEELYYAIAKREEGFKDQLIEKMVEQQNPPKDILEALLLESFKQMETNPFFRRYASRDEWELLMRKLPKELVEEHLHEDQEAGRRLFEAWKQEGAIQPLDSEVIVGLLRAVMLLSLHKEDIGKVYEPVRKLLVTYVIEGLTHSES